MRGAPPVRVAVGMDWPWAVVVGLLAVAAASIALTWAMVSSAAAMPGPSGSPAALALTALAVGWAAWVLAGVVRAVRRGRWPLQWNGVAWLMADPSAGPDAMVSCTVHVQFDSGGWLLLQVRPLPSVHAGRPRFMAGRRWAALHGRLHEHADWHALRCALYAPPAPAEPFAAPDGEREPRS